MFNRLIMPFNSVGLGCKSPELSYCDILTTWSVLTRFESEPLCVFGLAEGELEPWPRAVLARRGDWLASCKSNGLAVISASSPLDGQFPFLHEVLAAD